MHFKRNQDLRQKSLWHFKLASSSTVLLQPERIALVFYIMFKKLEKSWIICKNRDFHMNFSHESSRSPSFFPYIGEHLAHYEFAVCSSIALFIVNASSHSCSQKMDLDTWTYLHHPTLAQKKILERSHDTQKLVLSKKWDFALLPYVNLCIKFNMFMAGSARALNSI